MLIEVPNRTACGRVDLSHDGCHVGFAIIMQISYTPLRGQTTQIREIVTKILATQVICFQVH